MLEYIYIYIYNTLRGNAAHQATNIIRFQPYSIYVIKPYEQHPNKLRPDEKPSSIIIGKGMI